MKSNLLMKALIVLLITSLYSCQKENSDTPKFYIKFKKNGSWVTWKTAVGELGHDFLDDTKTNFGLSAMDDSQKESLNIMLQVDGTSLTTGSYNSKDHSLYTSYIMHIGSSSNKAFTNFEDASGQAEPHYVLKLTGISNEELRGSFTGNYMINTGNDKEKVEITEGEFVVARMR